MIEQWLAGKGEHTRRAYEQALRMFAATGVVIDGGDFDDNDFVDF